MNPHSFFYITTLSLLTLFGMTNVAVAAEAQFPPGQGADIANAYCMVCHSVDMVTQQPPTLSQKTWQAEVSKMQRFGATIPEDKVAALVAYLTATFSTLPASDVQAQKNKP